MRPALIPAFVTDFHNGLAGIDKQFAGMTDAQVPDKIKIGLLNILPEETAKGRNGHIGHGGNFFQGDGLQEMLEGIINDLFNGRVNGNGRVVKVCRQYFILLGGAHFLQALE